MTGQEGALAVDEEEARRPCPRLSSTLGMSSGGIGPRGMSGTHAAFLPGERRVHRDPQCARLGSPRAMVSWGRRGGRGRVEKEDQGFPSGGGGGPAVLGGLPDVRAQGWGRELHGQGRDTRTDRRRSACLSTVHGRFVAPSARTDAEASWLSGAPGQQSGARAGASAGGQLLGHLLGPSGSKRSSARITRPLQPRHRGAGLGRVPPPSPAGGDHHWRASGRPRADGEGGHVATGSPRPESASGQARSPEWTAPPPTSSSGAGRLQF